MNNQAQYICCNKKSRSKLQNLSRLIGTALFFSVLQFSIGNIQLIHKTNVAKINTQEDLDSFAVDLKVYLMIAITWTIIAMLILYGEHGIKGMILGFCTNTIIILLISISYSRAINIAVKKNNLINTTIF